MENNFERHIKESMENPPELPFQEGLWNDMEARLDQAQSKKRPFGFIGRLPLFLWGLAMTGLCLYLFMQQNTNTKNIQDTTPEEIAKQPLAAANDGIVKRITVIYDTIYNNIVVNHVQNQWAVEPSSQSRTAYQVVYHPDRFKLRLEKDVLFEVFEPSSLVASLAIPQRLSIGLRPTTTKQSETLVADDDFLQQEFDLTDFAFVVQPISELPTLQYLMLDTDGTIDLPEVKAKKMKRKKLLLMARQMRPTRFAVSGTTGTFASLNLGGQGFNLRGSANVEVGFGPQLSLVAGVEYFSNDFNRKLKEDEEYPLEGFPDLPPANSEDMLLDIQGDFNYLQIPFGLKYTFFPRRSFNPYTGIGLIYSRTARSRLEYEYQSDLGRYSVSEGRLLTRNFKLNSYWASIGVQVQMNNHWSLMLEGSSQFALSKGLYNYENLQLLKLSTGVIYEF